VGKTAKNEEILKVFTKSLDIENLLDYNSGSISMPT